MRIFTTLLTYTHDRRLCTLRVGCNNNELVAIIAETGLRAVNTSLYVALNEIEANKSVNFDTQVTCHEPRRPVVYATEYKCQSELTWSNHHDHSVDFLAHCMRSCVNTDASSMVYCY